MNIVRLVRVLSRTAIVICFWLVLGLSLLMSPEIDLQSLVFILVKSLAVSAVLWILLVIILDAWVKTLIADVEEKKVDRLQGGLSYHLVKSSPDEESGEDRQVSDEKADSGK